MTTYFDVVKGRMLSCFVLFAKRLTHITDVMRIIMPALQEIVMNRDIQLHSIPVPYIE